MTIFVELIYYIIPTRVRSTKGGYVFTGVCLFEGGGYPGLWHQVPSQPLAPGPFWEVPPSPVNGPVQSPVPGPVGGGDTPARTGQAPPRTGQGYPSRQERGYSPSPGQDRGTHLINMRATNATPRAVRLLRSRRRTFLFLLNSKHVSHYLFRNHIISTVFDPCLAS